MITAVDTAVLLDIVGGGSFGHKSLAAFQAATTIGRMIACEVVFAEFAAAYPSTTEAQRALTAFGLEFEPTVPGSAFEAGDVWRRYRAGGGPRTRVIADFLIGAHARVQADRLLTRDRGFYRAYFRDLLILDPTQT